MLYSFQIFFLESGNRRLQLRIKSEHPNVYRFGMVLQLEIDYFIFLAEKYSIGGEISHTTRAKVKFKSKYILLSG